MLAMAISALTVWVYSEQQASSSANAARHTARTGAEGARQAGKDFPTLGERWIVEGRVSDDTGEPVEGADIHVSAGQGTLQVTGMGKTDTHGHYRVEFGPGYLVAKSDRMGSLQAAIVHVSKDGFEERDLCHPGDLQMAWSLTKQQLAGGWQPGPQRVFLPGKPLSVDFVLVPAARIEGTLLDKEGKPIPNREIVLTGDRLRPASGVYAFTRTDAEGRFTFKDVSTLHAWSFSIDDTPGHPNRTPPDRFARPGEHRVRLELDGTVLKVIVVASATSSSGAGAPSTEKLQLRFIVPLPPMVVANGSAVEYSHRAKDGRAFAITVTPRWVPPTSSGTGK